MSDDEQIGWYNNLKKGKKLERIKPYRSGAVNRDAVGVDALKKVIADYEVKMCEQHTTILSLQSDLKHNESELKRAERDKERYQKWWNDSETKVKAFESDVRNRDERLVESKAYWKRRMAGSRLFNILTVRAIRESNPIKWLILAGVLYRRTKEV